MKDIVKMGIFFMAVTAFVILSDSQYHKYKLQMEGLQDELLDSEEKIAVCTKELEHLQAESAEIFSIEEYTTDTGFTKKGGVYLIDHESQLENMAQMIRKGAEIEPGVAAAEASYRLRNDLKVGDWFSIGTEQTPFCGNFDGDGKSISGRLFGRGNSVSALFLLGESGKAGDLEIDNYTIHSPDEDVSIVVGDDGECAEMEKKLENYLDYRIFLSINAWDLDTQKLADVLQKRFERNQEQGDYYISVFFDPKEGEEETIEHSHTGNPMTPFRMLAGEEWGKIMETADEQEEGSLRFIRLERIGGIKCCTFEIGELEDRRRLSEGYHIILEGEWEGKQVPLQHFFIPYTDMEMYALGRIFYMEKEDINFDGKQDLLIHEGASGGSGGSWENYRAIVWREETGQFEYYPSFPEQLHLLEFDRQRVISNVRLGAGCEYVIVYGVVNGEYVCTEELIWEHNYGEDESTLSYYKMGKLVQTHIVTDMDQEEWWQIYPDLDYWMRG